MIDETIYMRGIITKEERTASQQPIQCVECGQLASFYTFERRFASDASGERTAVDGPRTPYCGEHFDNCVVALERLRPLPERFYTITNPGSISPSGRFAKAFLGDTKDELK